MDELTAPRDLADAEWAVQEPLATPPIQRGRRFAAVVASVAFWPSRASSSCTRACSMAVWASTSAATGRL